MLAINRPILLKLYSILFYTDVFHVITTQQPKIPRFRKKKQSNVNMKIRNTKCDMPSSNIPTINDHAEDPEYARNEATKT